MLNSNEALVPRTERLDLLLVLFEAGLAKEAIREFVLILQWYPKPWHEQGWYVNVALTSFGKFIMEDRRFDLAMYALGQEGCFVTQDFSYWTSDDARREYSTNNPFLTKGVNDGTTI